MGFFSALFRSRHHAGLGMKGSAWSAAGLLSACLAVGSAASPAAAEQPSQRYAEALFVCRSVDPTGTPLNLREKPRGAIKGTIDSGTWFYVRGKDLQQPRSGYVAAYLKMPPLQTLTSSDGTAPGGWVWKAYITCELYS